MDCIRPATHNPLTGYTRDKCRCDECAAVGREYYRVRDANRGRTYDREAAIRHRKKKRAWVTGIKSESGCVICGYNKHPAALEFHHREGTTKSFSIGTFNASASYQNIIDEIKKCDVVCANCHSILTLDPEFFNE